MPTIAEWGSRPLEERLERLRRTPAEAEATIEGLTDDALSRRPGKGAWSAKEVLCHLRDIEEIFLLRFRTMLAQRDPTFLTLGDMPPDASRWGLRPGEPPPLDPDRWAEERQYIRNDAQLALASLSRRRAETLAFLDGLTPTEWERGSLHLIHGRMTYADWIALIAAHDDKHLLQMQRALSP